MATVEGTRPELRAFNSAGTLIATSGQSQDPALTVGATDSRTHFLEVRSTYTAATHPYSFTVNRLTPFDHGDDPSAAIDIPIGRITAGIMETREDVDYFQFAAVKGWFYTVAVTRPGNVTTKVRLYDRAGNLSGRIEGSGDYSRVWQAPEEGSYLVTVQGGAPFEYSIAVGPADFQQDFGNERETAHYLQLSETATGYLSSAHDVDFFKFDSEAGRSYQVEVTGTADNDVIVRLHGPDEQILASTSSRNGEAASFYERAVNAEQHYVSVTGSGENSNYLLLVTPDDHPGKVENATNIAVDEKIEAVLDGTRDLDTVQ